MNIDLSGRLALVTGATSNIGRVITRTLAECGGDIIVHYFSNQSMAARLVDEVRALGRRCIAVQGDVTDRESVTRMHRETVAGMGDPDIIITNAVIPYKWETILEQAVADYESQIRSCVLQNVLMAKAFVPAMKRKRWGRVVALNTECAILNRPLQSAYVAGKRGMDGVLRVLAKEVGEYQITVNQVAPGWMITDLNRGTDQERQPEYEANIPLRRRGQDRDVANAVAFLASDLASFISGVFLPVCGGIVMPAI